jgi:hypothetical protein
MTTNEVLIRHNFVSKIPFKNGLSKDLKVKIMSMRIEYAKVRKNFDEDLQEFVKEGASDEFKELQQKIDKTDEEELRLIELSEKFTAEYNAYITSRSSEEVNVDKKTFTIDEYNEIVSIIEDDSVEINGHILNVVDFLEVLYNLFVEE